MAAQCLLQDWAVGQARAGCYSRAPLSSNDSKTQQTVAWYNWYSARMPLYRYVRDGSMLWKFPDHNIIVGDIR